MSVTPSPIGGFAAQFFDNNGVILSGGKIYTYVAGTTTPLAAYTSAAGVTPHANPIVLDAAGRVPGGEIWLTDGLVYKFVLETATAVLIGTYDNITGVNSNFLNYTVQEEVQTATAGQTVFNLATIGYTPGTNSLTVYVDGVNQYVGDSYLETDGNTVTFTAGLHVGAEVKFTTAVQTTTGAVDASIVSYTAGFLGATAQTVQTKLEQYVSVKDFGAVGDFDLNTNTGTDDTAAIQAAIDWCAANGASLLQTGLSKITAPLVIPYATVQLQVVGSGAAKTFDAGWVYRGTGTMVTGNGVDKSLSFINFENMVFEGPGNSSGVNGFDGDFYQGGANNCIFRNWDTAVNCFGSINTFRNNRFLQNQIGLAVTNWPAGTSQADASTTTFVSERNSFFGNIQFGLNVDTSTTGGDDIISCVSRDDVFEQNGVGLYLNKSFDFLIERPHFEFHITAPFQIINSSPTVVTWYLHPGDAANGSITWSGAAANQAGYNNFNSNGTVLTRELTFTTEGVNTAVLSANDGGGIDWTGAGVVGTWTPKIGSTGGTSSGNTYSKQEGNYTRIGNLVIATFYVQLSAKDAGMGGYINVYNLPFASAATLVQSYGNALSYSGVTFTGGAYTQLNCDVITSTFEARPLKIGSGLTPAYLDPAELSATARLSGTITYLAAPL